MSIPIAFCNSLSFILKITIMLSVLIVILSTLYDLFRNLVDPLMLRYLLILLSDFILDAESLSTLV